MHTPTFGLAAALVLTLVAAGCSKERTAEADTGTAKAVITTEAPESVVPDEQLQQQAHQAATASSTPVDGTGPVATTTATPQPK